MNAFRLALSCSVIMPGLVWTVFDARAQTCAQAPSCSQLGYTQTASECSGKAMLFCPFDSTKVFCGVSKSCENLGYTMTTTQCTGRKYITCPYDATKVVCDMSAMIGEIRLWAGTTAPKGWKICNGSSLLIADYKALYDVIGTSFGGSGKNFNLPDFNGRVAVGTGTSYSGGSYKYEFGKTGGQNYVTLDKTEIPDHKHLLPWGENEGFTNQANPLWGYYNEFGVWGNAGGMAQDCSYWYSGYMGDRYSVRNNATSTSSSTTANTTKYSDMRIFAANTGAHENKMPFQVVNYIIYTGVYN